MTGPPEMKRADRLAPAARGYDKDLSAYRNPSQASTQRGEQRNGHGSFLLYAFYLRVLTRPQAVTWLAKEVRRDLEREATTS